MCGEGCACAAECLSCLFMGCVLRMHSSARGHRMRLLICAGAGGRPRMCAARCVTQDKGTVEERVRAWPPWHRSAVETSINLYVIAHREHSRQEEASGMPTLIATRPLSDRQQDPDSRLSRLAPHAGSHSTITQQNMLLRSSIWRGGTLRRAQLHASEGHLWMLATAFRARIGAALFPVSPPRAAEAPRGGAVGHARALLAPSWMLTESLFGSKTRLRDISGTTGARNSPPSGWSLQTPPWSVPPRELPLANAPSG